MRPAQLAEQIARSAPQSVTSPEYNSQFTEAHMQFAEPTTTTSARFRRFGRVFGQEWAPSILIFLLDIMTWMALYGTASYLRDASFSGPFQFAVIDLIQLIVILQALFIIGGYNPRTETRGLAYTAEHILALLCALGISALLIYGAAAFDHTMKPSRSAVLGSF